MNRAGLLTEVIKILSPKTIKSEYGEEKTEYIETYTTRARLIPQTYNREISNDEIVYIDRHTMTVYYYVPVEEFDLIVWCGKRYRILSILPKREFNEKEITIERINE